MLRRWRDVYWDQLLNRSVCSDGVYPSLHLGDVALEGILPRVGLLERDVCRREIPDHNPNDRIGTEQRRELDPKYTEDTGDCERRCAIRYALAPSETLHERNGTLGQGANVGMSDSSKRLQHSPSKKSGNVYILARGQSKTRVGDVRS